MAHSVRDPAPKAVEDALERVRRSGNEPLRAAFMTRILNAVAHLAEDVDPWVLSDASSESSDYAVLFSVLNQPEALATLRRDDPLAEARLAGLRSRELLLGAEGGAVAADQAASLLGISRQAVDRRRRAGKLIGLTLGRRGFAYPAWQFAEGGTLAGLDETLAALHEYGPWMQTAWFVNPNTRLDGDTPLMRLRRKDVAPVVAAARLYGEQGG